jgi:Ca2+-binding RTX toxin-like protein
MNETIFNPNPLPQIIGTDRSNFLSGTERSEQISGLGGNDTIFGRNGNDVISGGAGNDTIDGGNGDDNISGDEGNDLLIGSSGNDALIAFGGGNDVLIGGSGKDTFSILDYEITNPSAGSLDTFIGSIRGVKTIGDFKSSEDLIEIDYGIPGGNIFTPARDFATVTRDRDAEFSNAIIVYNQTNGKLFVNHNGSAAGFNSTGSNNSQFNGGEFAILSGKPQLFASNIVLPSGGDLAAT